MRGLHLTCFWHFALVLVLLWNKVSLKQIKSNVISLFTIRCQFLWWLLLISAEWQRQNTSLASVTADVATWCRLILNCLLCAHSLSITVLCNFLFPLLDSKWLKHQSVEILFFLKMSIRALSFWFVCLYHIVVIQMPFCLCLSLKWFFTELADENH